MLQPIDPGGCHRLLPTQSQEPRHSANWTMFNKCPTCRLIYQVNQSQTSRKRQWLSLKACDFAIITHFDPFWHSVTHDLNLSTSDHAQRIPVQASSWTSCLVFPGSFLRCPVDPGGASGWHSDMFGLHYDAQKDDMVINQELKMTESLWYIMMHSYTITWRFPKIGLPIIHVWWVFLL